MTLTFFSNNDVRSVITLPRLKDVIIAIAL
jgi:hypothetical protein